MTIRWYRTPDGGWAAQDDTNPQASDATIPAGSVLQGTTVANQYATSPGASAAWTWDPTSNTWKTNLNPTPYAQPAGGSNPMPVITNQAQVTGAAAGYAGAGRTQQQVYQDVGSYPSWITDPYWAMTLVQRGLWQKQPIPNEPGGFWVRDQTGQVVGAYHPAYANQSEFGPGGEWKGASIPPSAQALLAGQNTPTLAATIAQNQLTIADRNNANALQLAQLNAQSAQQIAQGNNQTQLTTTGMNNQTQLGIANLNNQLQLQIAQLNDATRRLESDRQYYIQTGQLDLARLTEQHQHELDVQRQALDERKFALDVLSKQAELGANPFNAFQNALFVNGLEANPALAKYGTPSPNALNGLLPAGQPAGTGAYGDPGPGGQGNPQTNSAIANLPIFQKMAATGGQTIQGLFGTPIAKGGQNANFRTFNRALPSDQELYQGGVKTTGQYLPDFVESMKRAAPTGGFSGLAKYG